MNMTFIHDPIYVDYIEFIEMRSKSIKSFFLAFPEYNPTNLK